MSILVDKDTRVVVQGITGSAGSFHAKQCWSTARSIVAGVTPGKGGQTFEGKVPIFDTVEQAVKATGANASVIFVPPPFAADSILEAADAGSPLVITITEGIPVNDMVKVKRVLDGIEDAAASAPTARASSRPARSARSASCRATFTSPAASASCRARARSPTRPSTR